VRGAARATGGQMWDGRTDEKTNEWTTTGVQCGAVCYAFRSRRQLVTDLLHSTVGRKQFPLGSGKTWIPSFISNLLLNRFRHTSFI
jgi:hypothetical protein